MLIQTGAQARRNSRKKDVATTNGILTAHRMEIICKKLVTKTLCQEHKRILEARQQVKDLRRERINCNQKHLRRKSTNQPQYKTKRSRQHQQPAEQEHRLELRLMYHGIRKIRRITQPQNSETQQWNFRSWK